MHTHARGCVAAADLPQNAMLMSHMTQYILQNKEQNNPKMLACCAASISWMELRLTPPSPPRPPLSNMLDEPPCDWCGDGAGGGPGAPG